MFIIFIEFFTKELSIILVDFDVMSYTIIKTRMLMIKDTYENVIINSSMT